MWKNGLKIVDLRGEKNFFDTFTHWEHKILWLFKKLLSFSTTCGKLCGLPKDKGLKCLYSCGKLFLL